MTAHTMNRNLDFKLIFPVKDDASASFMLCKAYHLHQAGVISLVEKQAVAGLYLRFAPDPIRQIDAD